MSARHMSPEKTQAGNPHRLTVRQHVFPAKAIGRFVGTDGKVAVRHIRAENEFRLFPDNELFCAERCWDQRAEAGYMRSIENDFDQLSIEVLGGLRKLNCKQSSLATRFFALWHFRSHYRPQPVADRPINGIVEEGLSKNEEELLESKHVSFLRSDQMMPGRMVTGLHIQILIDQAAKQLQDVSWGVVTSGEGEFVLPDTFGGSTIVPLTPTVCLICACKRRRNPKRKYGRNKSPCKPVGTQLPRCAQLFRMPFIA
jgi:hypothetical protein